MVLSPSSAQENLPALMENLLSINENDKNAVIDSLTNLRIALSKLSAQNIYSLLTNPILEGFIRSASPVTSGELYDLCREILECVLAAIPPSDFFQRFHGEIVFALNSNSSMIKITFLHAIKNVVEKDPTVLNDIPASNSPILISICRCVTDSDISVYEAAKTTVVFLVKCQPKGPSILFNSNLAMEALKGMLVKGDIERFRLHELTSELAQISPEILSFCVKYEFIAALLNELKSRDILGELNALEIMTQMVSGSKHCVDYLHSLGVLNNLHDLLTGSQESPDSTFLFPAVMKLFGHLARLYPKECCEKYPKFLNAVFHLVINYQLLEVGQRLLAFDTLGLLASTPDGKLVLSNYDPQMERCMKCFCQAVREGPMELRVRHLEALSNFLKLEVPDQTENLLILNEKWFSMMDKAPMEVLFGIFKQPFTNIHCASGDVLKRLAVQMWGQRTMFQQAGFAEYLLNRSTETTMEGRYVKYEIVNLLANSPSIGRVVDATILQRLMQYRTQGPYYVQGQLDVALEDA